ncbi:MAG: hypothetical protein ABI222_16670 [Opitutaceae bacterium]
MTCIKMAYSPIHPESSAVSRTDAFLCWSGRMAPLATRASLALIFVWFGLLKIFGVSPAAELVSRTFFFIPSRIVVPTLGLAEFVIGVCFIVRRLLPLGLVLLALHLPGTFLSFIVVPDMCFNHSIFLLTTDGEFILKNLLLISAALFLAGTRARDPLVRP